MKRLQDDVPDGELLALEADDHPARDTAQAALEKDVREAAGGFRTGLEPAGEAAQLFPLEDYSHEDEWAAVVLEHLSEAHRAPCTEVRLKQLDQVPCGQCVFWRAAR